MLKDYYTKISRNILNTPYYDNSSLLRAWIGLIMSVRFQPAVIDGIEVGVNEILLRKNELQDVFGANKRRAYDILKRMEYDGLITWINIRNKYTLIKVIEEDFSSLNKKKAEKENHLCEKKTDFSEKTEEAFSAVTEKHKPCIGEPKNNKPADNRDSFYTYRTEKRDEYLRTDTLKEERKEEKREEITEHKFSYGEFNNVLLTRTEYNSLINKFPDARLFIEKLSSYLVSNPGKKYPNHYAVIISWYSDHLLKQRKPEERKQVPEKNSVPEPDPTASYDIKRAELRARTHVPTVKKRNKS